MGGSIDDLRRENDELRRRLQEAEAVVRAISKNEVDAFVVEREGEDSVLVLDGVEEPYRLLAERMQQGAAVLTWDGVIVYANRGLGELVGVPAASLPGTTFTSFLPAEHHAAFARLLVGGERAAAEQELALHKPGGGEFPALLNFSPFLAQNRIVCVIVTDLRQQKRHEAERQRLVQEQAARAAAEQVAEVLRSADRRKDEFLAMLGHELRNPLAPLRNGLLILNQIGSREPEQVQTRDMMGRQLESLIRLVDDLLDVGRVTQGKITLQRVPTDLKTVVSRALESCRTFVEAHRHHIVLTLPAGAAPVLADMVRLTQVVTNLLNNAVKFTPDGGEIAVQVAADEATREGVIRVRDNGLGIAPEMLGRVFDLFAQADPSASRTEGGLGIGLTLARRLVEMHGGRLTADSLGLGQGSEFTVRLPLAEDFAERRNPQPAANPANSKSKRVLIVDDNRDAAKTLGMILRLLGHEVREAHDGRQALAVVEDYTPDLMLLDIGLPGLNGYEVAERLRGDERFRQVRIVALSGYGGDEDRKRARAAGFDAHLVKPVEMSAVQALFAL